MSLLNKYIDSSDFLTATAVYDDANLLTKAADGYYQDNDIYRQQVNGELGPSFVCEECGIPCGGTISPPGGATGLYQLEFSAGTDENDTGAISIYFNPQGIPDGIRVFYDGVFYNRVSSPNDGNIQSTSGVADAFTILGNPTSTCVPATPDTSNYDFFDGFDESGWIPGSPTPQSVTINTGDDVRGGASQDNLLVVPKPNRLPGLVTIQVLGPCSGTGWNIDVECPQPLPSFQGRAIGSSITCQSTNTTYYFGRFQGATNTYPELNNPVFSDINGVSRVSDQNYIMDNNQVITVTNGVVSSITPCDPV
jgi:hypothetical protein